jgi:polyhydroxyalkanoate synthesis regulator phasin
VPSGAAAQAGTGERDLGSLYQEVRRIREIAEAREATPGRVAELTQEVQELRATVARLRGSAAAAAH